MKKIIFILMSLFIAGESQAWGKTGHRVVGLIAEWHVSKKAKRNIEKILGHESLAEVSNYMDFIKSEPDKSYMNPWHYMTIPDGTRYTSPPAEGDVLETIERLTRELQSGSLSPEDEAFALKCLVHLVGDIHQPLHVGNGQDRGGNDIEVVFFWQNSNLHRVWDSGIIDQQQYSYTEYAKWINHTTKEQVEDWQSSTVLDWAYESMQYREQVYDLPDDNKINYRYVYDNIDVVNQRLLQAGVRLAGLLNRIYG
jgi:hypothetical protein